MLRGIPPAFFSSPSHPMCSMHELSHCGPTRGGAFRRGPPQVSRECRHVWGNSARLRELVTAARARGALT